MEHLKLFTCVMHVCHSLALAQPHTLSSLQAAIDKTMTTVSEEHDTHEVTEHVFRHFHHHSAQGNSKQPVMLGFSVSF